MQDKNMAAIEVLKTELPAEAWTTDKDIIAPFLVEWRDKYFGHTPIMLTPRNTQEVVQAVKICAAQGLSIVPQGGNTGLVGGQTPMGEVLLSLRKMTTIRDISVTNNAITVEAGAPLVTVQNAADEVGLKFPLSLASEGFLGAEGTLGIITAATLKLFPKPRFVQRVMCAVNSPKAALALLDMSGAGGALAMFEVMPKIGLDLVTTHMPDQRYPFEAPYDWFALIDWEVESEEAGQDLATGLLETAFEAAIIQDAVIAQNETQGLQLLNLRENMSEGQKYLGGSIKQDITVPIDRIPEFFERSDKAVEIIVPACRPVGFGHFGDGNIHYNVGAPDGADKETFLSKWDDISRAVFDIVDDLGGSISAEHGIGTMKKGDLVERADPVKMTLLKSVKKALDPQGIMNPRVLV